MQQLVAERNERSRTAALRTASLDPAAAAAPTADWRSVYSRPADVCACVFCRRFYGYGIAVIGISAAIHLSMNNPFASKAKPAAAVEAKPAH